MLSRSVGMLSRSVYNTSYKLKSFKFSKIFAVFLLLLFLCADSFNNDVFAARKKSGKKVVGKSARRSAGSSRKAKTSKKSGKSSRRSAGSSKKSTKSSRRSASSSKGAKKSGKSSRRSASSSRKSSRRSASSSSRSSRRSAFATGVRKKRTSAGSRGVSETSANTDVKETLQTYGLQPCSLGKALWQNPDEDREGVYYKSRKTACYLPENAEVSDWKKDSDIVKAPWISDDEAVVIDCESGFLKTIQNKRSVCVDESSFCPLNRQVVEKQGKTFINAYTEKECNKPVNTKAVRLTKDQLNLAGYDIKFGKAFYLQCKEGFYTKNNDIECKKCPKFCTSIQGKNIGEQSCIPVKDCEKEFGKDYVMSAENGECVESQDVLEDETIKSGESSRRSAGSSRKSTKSSESCKKENKKYNENSKSCGDCLSGYLLNSKGVCVNKKDALREKAIAYCKENNMGYDWDKEDSLLMSLWENYEQKVSQSFDTYKNNTISDYLMRFNFVSALKNIQNGNNSFSNSFVNSGGSGSQNLYGNSVRLPDRFVGDSSNSFSPRLPDRNVGDSSNSHLPRLPDRNVGDSSNSHLPRLPDRFVDDSSKSAENPFKGNLITTLPVKPPRYTDFVGSQEPVRAPVFNEVTTPVLPPHRGGQRFDRQDPIFDRITLPVQPPYKDKDGGEKVKEPIKTTNPGSGDVTVPVSPPTKDENKEEIGKTEKPVKVNEKKKDSRLLLCKTCPAGSKIDENGRCI